MMISGCGHSSYKMSYFLVMILYLAHLGLLGCYGLPIPSWSSSISEATTHRGSRENEKLERTERRLSDGSSLSRGDPVVVQEVRLSLRDGSGDGNSSFFGSLQECRTKGLCPEGIANIVAGALALSILGLLACILWHWDAQADRKARIRHAMERNKIIDQQMEEERKKRHERAEQFIAQAQEEGRTAGAPDHGGLEMSMQDMTSDSELSSDERKGLLQVKSKSPTSDLTVTAEVVSS